MTNKSTRAVYDADTAIPESGHRIPPDGDIPFGGRVDAKLTEPEPVPAKQRSTRKRTARDDRSESGSPAQTINVTVHVYIHREGANDSPTPPPRKQSDNRFSALSTRTSQPTTSAEWENQLRAWTTRCW